VKYQGENPLNNLCILLKNEVQEAKTGPVWGEYQYRGVDIRRG
jgi:hypothetical protein